MSAAIIPFPLGGARPLMPASLATNVTFTKQWVEQHLPLIDAAMDLIHADDAEFDRRCRLMTDGDGRSMLEDLCGQLDRLGSHIGDVADALGMTAARIREAMCGDREQPA